MLHDFRWEERYSSTSHDEEVTQARQHLFALEEVQGAKQRIVDNIKQGISKALMEGQAPNPVFTETLEEANAALVEAENAVAIADRQLAALKSKTVGKAAAREARAKVRAFMDSRLDTYEEREKFNEWLHTTGLVVLVSPVFKTAEVCLGVVADNRLKQFEAASEMILAAMQGKDNDKMRAHYLEGVAERLKTGKSAEDDLSPEDFNAALRKHLPVDLFPPDADKLG
jgi:hypothetical protein